MSNRPLFLSLDGLDGTGKSTQCQLLAEWLRGQNREVISCIDPGGTPLGQELRQILLSKRRAVARECEALLFMASRAQLVADVIRPALASGMIVISDRYLLANIVYQGYAGGLDVELIRQAGRLSTGGLEPDRTFVLDLPVEMALSRRGRPSDRMESQPGDYHQRVRDGFLSEARIYPERLMVVDARPSLDEIQVRLRQEVSRLLDGKEKP